MEFEKAALYRDQLQSIEKLYSTQKVVGIGKENIDVLGLALDGDNALFEILFIRDGIMTGHDNYLMEGATDETEENLIPKFMQQFYTNSSSIPNTILSPLKTDDEKFFINWISEEHKRRIAILSPKRGEKRKLILMASENAKESLYQLNAKTLSNRTLMEQALSELQEELSLPNFPRRIECFDIFILGNSMYNDKLLKILASFGIIAVNVLPKRIFAFHKYLGVELLSSFQIDAK